MRARTLIVLASTTQSVNFSFKPNLATTHLNLTVPQSLLSSTCVAVAFMRCHTTTLLTVLKIYKTLADHKWVTLLLRETIGLRPATVMFRQIISDDTHRSTRTTQAATPEKNCQKTLVQPEHRRPGQQKRCCLTREVFRDC